MFYLYAFTILPYNRLGHNIKLLNLYLFFHVDLNCLVTEYIHTKMSTYPNTFGYISFIIIEMSMCFVKY